MQDALAVQWKSHFPGMRFLSYRIPSAVPYDAVVRDKIVSDPDFFVRWSAEPSNQTKSDQKCAAPGSLGSCGVGDVCYNNISPCFNDPQRINAPAHNCSFQIKAAAYNWLNPAVGDWYINNVLLRSLEHADGIWLDGNGYDNGAWMCSGICCGFGAQNSPLNQMQIDSFCAAEADVATRGRQQLIARGGFDGLNCMTFMVESLPQARDDPDICASKLLSTAAWASNHSNYHAVVAYGYDTGAGGYNDTTAAGAVAAFHIMRGQHWFFGIGVRSAHMFIIFTVRNGTRIRERGIARPKNTLPPFSFLFFFQQMRREIFFLLRKHTRQALPACKLCFFELLAFSQDSLGAKILTLVAAICARTHAHLDATGAQPVQPASLSRHGEVSLGRLWQALQRKLEPSRPCHCAAARHGLRHAVGGRRKGAGEAVGFVKTVREGDNPTGLRRLSGLFCFDR